jgi:hypothetical protein
MLMEIRLDLKNPISGDMEKFASSTRLHGITSQDDSIPHRYHVRTSYLTFSFILTGNPKLIELICTIYLYLLSHLTFYFRNKSYILLHIFVASVSRDSLAGIATGYGLDDRGIGVRVPVGSRIFSSPRRPHRLWGPPCLLSNAYREFFPGGKAVGA